MKDLFDVEQLSQFEFGAIIITVLVAGLVFGCLLAYALLKRKNSPDAEAAVTIKEEFEQYKDKVDDHFIKTSEMFKDVTTQYKQLYDHMAVGAIELSKADTITMPRLEMQDSDETEVVETALDETAVVTSNETPADDLDNTPENGPDDEPNNVVEPEESANQDSDQQIDLDDDYENNTAKTT